MSAFAEMVLFPVVGPTAPSGVKRRANGPQRRETGGAVDVGLGLGLRLKVAVGLTVGLSTELTLLGMVPTEDKSK